MTETCNRRSDAADWHREVSQPEFEMVVEEDVQVTLRDGVTLSVDVYRPKSDGRFPGLLSLSIYGKLAQKLPTNPVHQPSDYITGTGGHECGEQNFFVPRGYVHVIPDVRGVGNSEGVFPGDLGVDGYDLVEWMAQQPWCNGNIGMLGMSQFAHAQFQVAALKPPHLKAICPFEGRTDPYRHHYYHGGILNYLFPTGYSRLLPVHTKNPEPASFREFTKQERDARVKALLVDPDIRCLPYLALAASTPQMNPLIFDLLMHPHDGPFYERQSSYARFADIEIPALLGSRWNGAVLHLPGAFEAYDALPTPAAHKKLLVVPSDNYGGMDRPFHEIQDVVLRFYDHWLKGNDSGMMDEPPMLFYVQGTGAWRHENEFPLAATQWTKLYLHGSGDLSPRPPENEATVEFQNEPWLSPVHGSANADPRAVRQPIPAAVWDLQVSGADLELTGPLALYWHASIRSEAVAVSDPASPGASELQPLTNDTNWYLKVYDVDPEGAKRCVAEGWLKASHHEVDEAKSQPWRPYHPHTRNLPIGDDEVILYAADLRMTCNVFRAGHRMRLEIAAQDEVQALWYHVPHMAKVHHRIFCSAARPSHLLVPVIPRGYRGAGEPQFPPGGPFRIPRHVK